MATPEDILHRWVDGVNRGEVQSVAELYDDDSVLVPTFCPDTLYTRPRVEGYFQNLAKQGGAQVILDEDSVTTRALGGACYLLTGQYVFRMGTGDAAAACSSRFTMVIDVSKARPILHHHSSQRPEGSLDPEREP